MLLLALASLLALPHDGPDPIGSWLVSSAQVEEGRLVRRPVEVGLDNNRMVRIVSGLAEGELVALAPPLDEADAPDGGDAGERATEDGDVPAGDPAGSDTVGEAAAAAGGSPPAEEAP